MGGRGCANCFNPNAVMIAMIFVSCEKSKYSDWLSGKVDGIPSSVTLA